MPEIILSASERSSIEVFVESSRDFLRQINTDESLDTERRREAFTLARYLDSVLHTVTFGAKGAQP